MKLTITIPDRVHHTLEVLSEHELANIDHAGDARKLLAWLACGIPSGTWGEFWKLVGVSPEQANQIGDQASELVGQFLDAERESDHP